MPRHTRVVHCLGQSDVQREAACGTARHGNRYAGQAQDVTVGPADPHGGGDRVAQREVQDRRRAQFVTVRPETLDGEPGHW
ncbi:hypothetical protein [Streptomyces shenzhenensis]|uniref:hypothetical protein n=1 Tax=Streptomyces shenzhenensis TaxID=943815 RepID=UPI001F42A308|nr:hypothetical protein [Streptomyces shenzhenensis]